MFIACSVPDGLRIYRRGSENSMFNKEFLFLSLPSFILVGSEFSFLRVGLSTQSWLAWNLNEDQACIQPVAILQFFFLFLFFLLSVRVTGVHHCSQLLLLF